MSIKKRQPQPEGSEPILGLDFDNGDLQALNDVIEKLPSLLYLKTRLTFYFICSINGHTNITSRPSMG